MTENCLYTEFELERLSANNQTQSTFKSTISKKNPKKKLHAMWRDSLLNLRSTNSRNSAKQSSQDSSTFSKVSSFKSNPNLKNLRISSPILQDLGNSRIDDLAPYRHANIESNKKKSSKKGNFDPILTFWTRSSSLPESQIKESQEKISILGNKLENGTDASEAIKSILFSKSRNEFDSLNVKPSAATNSKPELANYSRAYNGYHGLGYNYSSKNFPADGHAENKRINHSLASASFITSKSTCSLISTNPTFIIPSNIASTSSFSTESLVNSNFSSNEDGFEYQMFLQGSSANLHGLDQDFFDKLPEKAKKPYKNFNKSHSKGFRENSQLVKGKKNGFQKFNELKEKQAKSSLNNHNKTTSKSSSNPATDTYTMSMTSLYQGVDDSYSHFNYPKNILDKASSFSPQSMILNQKKTAGLLLENDFLGYGYSRIRKTDITHSKSQNYLLLNGSITSFASSISFDSANEFLDNNNINQNLVSGEGTDICVSNSSPSIKQNKPISKSPSELKALSSKHEDVHENVTEKAAHSQILAKDPLELETALQTCSSDKEEEFSELSYKQCSVNGKDDIQGIKSRGGFYRASLADINNECCERISIPQKHNELCTLDNSYIEDGDTEDEPIKTFPGLRGKERFIETELNAQGQSYSEKSFSARFKSINNRSSIAAIGLRESIVSLKMRKNASKNKWRWTSLFTYSPSNPNCTTDKQAQSTIKVHKTDTFSEGISKSSEAKNCVKLSPKIDILSSFGRKKALRLKKACSVVLPLCSTQEKAIYQGKSDTNRKSLKLERRVDKVNNEFIDKPDADNSENILLSKIQFLNKNKQALFDNNDAEYATSDSYRHQNLSVVIDPKGQCQKENDKLNISENTFDTSTSTTTLRSFEVRGTKSLAQGCSPTKETLGDNENENENALISNNIENPAVTLNEISNLGTKKKHWDMVLPLSSSTQSIPNFCIEVDDIILSSGLNAQCNRDPRYIKRSRNATTKSSHPKPDSCIARGSRVLSFDISTISPQNVINKQAKTKSMFVGGIPTEERHLGYMNKEKDDLKQVFDDGQSTKGGMNTLRAGSKDVPKGSSVSSHSLENGTEINIQTNAPDEKNTSPNAEDNKIFNLSQFLEISKNTKLCSCVEKKNWRFSNILDSGKYVTNTDLGIKKNEGIDGYTCKKCSNAQNYYKRNSFKVQNKHFFLDNVITKNKNVDIIPAILKSRHSTSSIPPFACDLDFSPLFNTSLLDLKIENKTVPKMGSLEQNDLVLKAGTEGKESENNSSPQSKIVNDASKISNLIQKTTLIFSRSSQLFAEEKDNKSLKNEQKKRKSILAAARNSISESNLNSCYNSNTKPVLEKERKPKVTFISNNPVKADLPPINPKSSRRLISHISTLFTRPFGTTSTKNSASLTKAYYKESDNEESKGKIQFNEIALKDEFEKIKKRPSWRESVLSLISKRK
ncbi:hypothetical protein BB560_003248 [Smittium megazygosporum]|uniref:Uncharacterized protein n=1 Tax=Smittium megazygosporum TaxID=133381 RepID=A0A2T9ZCL3_9FUNG|nr:hypothetical protein BB560_003248 [Smittium megazygosporum]